MAFCSICDYSSKTKAMMTSHLQSTKHLINCHEKTDGLVDFLMHSRLPKRDFKHADFQEVNISDLDFNENDIIWDDDSDFDIFEDDDIDMNSDDSYDEFEEVDCRCGQPYLKMYEQAHLKTQQHIEHDARYNF